MARIQWTANTIARAIGLVLVVGAGVFLLTYTPTREPLEEPSVVRPAKILEIESVGQAASRNYSGVVQATAHVDLSFRVSGPLIQLPIQRGQEVKKGALLAQIDLRDFQTHLAGITSSLDEACANLKAMKAGERVEVVQIRERALAASKADLENAELELSRHEKLIAENVISQSEYDKVRLRRDTAKEKMEAAEQDLEQAKKGARPEDIEAQEATIRGLEAQQQTARHALDDTSLTAPFDGLIAKQYVENFQDVTAKQPIVSLQDVSKVEIVANVPEAVVALVCGRKKMVDRLAVTFESVPGREFDVEYEEMETEADPRTQTFAVTVVMPAPDDVRILPGMPAMFQMHIKPSATESRGVYVPASAVLADDAGAPRVWKVDPDTMTVHLVPVEVGEMMDDRILVRKGLECGDWIVTAGVHFLRDGMTVRRLGSE